MFRSFYITGAGAVTPFGEGLDAFVEGVHRGADALETGRGALQTFDPKRFLNLDRIRGYDRLTLIVMSGIKDLYSRHLLGRAEEVAGGFRPEEVGACLGTSGPLGTISEFDFQVIEDPQFVQPSAFPNCVSCAPLGYASIYSKIHASNTTLSNGATSGVDSLGYASSLLGHQGCRVVLAGGAEALSHQYQSIMEAKFRLRGLVAPVLSEGAVFFSCEAGENREDFDRQPLGKVVAYSTCFSDDAQEALQRNWDIVQMELGQDLSRYTAVLLGSERRAEAETQFFSGLGWGHFESIDVAPALGDFYSASGSVRTLYGLVHQGVASGSLILVSCTCLDGNNSLLAIEKP